MAHRCLIDVAQERDPHVSVAGMRENSGGGVLTLVCSAHTGNFSGDYNHGLLPTKDGEKFSNRPVPSHKKASPRGGLNTGLETA